MTGVSPLAPASFPAMPAIDGVRMGTAAAGIRYRGREDVLAMLFDAGTTVAGVFTRSKCPSAPVDWCRQIMPAGRARVLLVNSGNANAFTGKLGVASTRQSAEIIARAAACRTDEVYLASTGVIGEPLDASKFEPVASGLIANASADRWAHAARAIMTTDTFPKGATAQARIGDATVTINGIAKGAGMIAPDMATMLSFVATDAAIAAPVLQALLAALVKTTFNATTVDGDTSTSDTLLIFATGKAGGASLIEDVADPQLRPFRRALRTVLTDLAQQVARDGEGAQKFITVNVTGATTRRSAHRIAMSIANSPLVKTAVAGEDANWGRVVMAVGKAGEPADRDRLAIWFGEHRVATEGQRDGSYSEDATSAYMKNREVTIRVDLGLGEGKATVWTCDLTHGYIDVNGSYRS